MSATSFKCDEDLYKTIQKIHKKTGVSRARIINDAIRNSFEKSDIYKALEENKKRQEKILFVLKEVVRYRENGDEFIKQIESDFEKYYEYISKIN